MTLQAIPTSEDPFYSQVTALDGVDYILTFTYNQREAAWYVTFSTTGGEDLVRGVKLVPEWPLLGNQVDARLPPGTLMVLSNTTDDSPPGLLELGEGKRCELVYLPFGE